MIRDRIQDAALTDQLTPANISQGDIAVMQSLDRSAIPFPQLDQTTDDVLTKSQVNAIGAKELLDATYTLQKYKEGKANLERRVIENQEWYKLRQWEVLRRKAREGKKNQVEPASGWLVNAVDNKHATSMDNFPRPKVDPREQNDEAEARKLSSVLPVLLDACEFEQTYSDLIYDKLINGTGIYGIFWDDSKYNGLGEVAIETVDILNLFWEPGIRNIDNSRNIFYVSILDNEVIESEYPQFANKLGGMVMNVSQYVYDDTVDTSEKSIVVDWYYKKKQNGKTVLHFCKFILGQAEPIFATENDPAYADRGWYDDGEYPFVFDVMFPCKGTPCGFGYIDKGKSTQEYIDREEQAIQSNLLFNARPRHFISSSGSVNEEEYADATKDLVHVDGNLGQDSVMPIQVNPLNAVYVEIHNNKIEELKETTGNRDVSTGGTSGATAASAIAAQQEASAKLDRDSNKGSYRAFRKAMLKVVERMRQFYDEPRYFRITGENGISEFVPFSNAGIKPQYQGVEFGVDMGFRLPTFDIQITAEKESPYTRMAQNELALQFYSSGFFFPQNAPATLACLNMMDFDHKDEVVRMVMQNGSMYSMMVQAQQQALQLASALDAQTGSNITPQLMAQYGAQTGGAPQGGPPPAIQNTEAPAGEGKESSITKKAREKTAQMSAPR